MTLGLRSHTDREFDAEIKGLRQDLLAMTGRVEAMITASLEALVEDDMDRARATVLADRAVNQAEVDADDKCMRIMARWQPMARDLRFLLFTLKVVTDIERIGDLAVNICERVIELHGGVRVEPTEDLIQMGRVVQAMLDDAVRAFVDGDASAARAVMDRDDEVDALYHRFFRSQLHAIACEDEAEAESRIRLQSIAKYLERMGDHTTNLGEQVIFLLRGTDVRHEGKRPR